MTRLRIVKSLITVCAISSSTLNAVLVTALFLRISFVTKTTLYARTDEGLKFIKAYVNITRLEIRFKAKDSDVSSSRYSLKVIFF